MRSLIRTASRSATAIVGAVAAGGLPAFVLAQTSPEVRKVLGDLLLRVSGTVLVVLVVSVSINVSKADQPNSPRERVERFIKEFRDGWQETQAPGENGRDYDRWRDIQLSLERRHFLPNAKIKVPDVVFADEPMHSPGAERVINESRDGTHAIVETQGQHFLLGYWKYDLAQSDGQWRIARMTQFLSAPNKPLLNDVSTLGAASPDAPFQPADPTVEVNGDRLFEDGRELRDGTTIEVRQLGKLNLPTGVIVTGDFGYGGDMLHALERQVAPGEYAVAVAIARHTVAALRIALSDRPVVNWHPAVSSTGRDGVGVDAGNVAVTDRASVTGVLDRDRERVFKAHVERDRAAGFGAAGLDNLKTRNDVVITDSGIGDGGYPHYWGVDAGGEPAVFLLDFQVLGERIERTIEVQLVDGKAVPNDELAAAGVSIEIGDTDRGAELVVDGHAKVIDFELLDADGAWVIGSRKRGRRASLSDYDGSKKFTVWEPPVPADSVHTARVRINAGWRN